MGRQALGVLYGCVVPEGVELYDSENALVDKWEAVKANRKLKLSGSDPDADKQLIGFWVGIGGDEKGIPDLSGKCIPLTVIEKSKDGKKAVDSWKVFVAFAKENGVHFPTPTFWLAPIDVG